MVGIVADGGSALPDDVARTHGVLVVPMQVDAPPPPDRSPGPGDGMVRTAAPSPGQWMAAIERADDGEGVVILTVHRRFSSSADSARLAARQSGHRVEVVDTGTAAGAEALVVLAAATAARTGLSLDPVAKHAEFVGSRVRLVAAVGDLTPLARSGRLPRPLARLGHAVGVRPVFELRRGSIRLLRPGLSARGAQQLMVETWRRSVRAGSLLHVAVMHAGDEAGAEELLDRVSAVVTPATSLVTRFGPAMVAHTGPDLRGLAWWWEPGPRPGDGGDGDALGD